MELRDQFHCGLLRGMWWIEVDHSGLCLLTIHFILCGFFMQISRSFFLPYRDSLGLYLSENLSRPVRVLLWHQLKFVFRFRSNVMPDLIAH